MHAFDGGPYHHEQTESKVCQMASISFQGRGTSEPGHDNPKFGLNSKETDDAQKTIPSSALNASQAAMGNALPVRRLLCSQQQTARYGGRYSICWTPKIETIRLFHKQEAMRAGLQTYLVSSKLDLLLSIGANNHGTEISEISEASGGVPLGPVRLSPDRPNTAPTYYRTWRATPVSTGVEAGISNRISEFVVKVQRKEGRKAGRKAGRR
ncbi:hypothetical protein C8R47DRAFT_1070224 [Mycena vitilis]|nr:hypothetical protein C8R47DRAFT_1070224 [Mycena vitilis]